MAIEIVDFPMKNGGSFHCKMLVHQRVSKLNLFMRRPLATATVVDLKRQACRFGFCHVQCVFPLLRSWQEALPGLWRSWGADGPMETCSHHHLSEAKTTGLSGHLMSVEDHTRATAYACNE